MNRMDIDMGTAGNDANSLGPLNLCVEAAPGDDVIFDVTVEGVPATNGAIIIQAELLYPEAAFSVVAQDFQFFLAQNTGSTVYNPGPSPPDTNGDNIWLMTMGDSSSPPGMPETGDGVAARATVEVDAGAPAGQHLLAIGSQSAHVNAQNNSFVPLARGNAYIAVGVDCDVDFDGIEDSQDACPTFPGDAENQGCPPPGPSVVGGVAGLIEGGEGARDEAVAGGGKTSLPYLLGAAVLGLLGAAAGWRAVRRRAE
jgi:hypothetical protein